MVLLNAAPLNEPGARAYLEATDVLPSLEIGLEDMLQACANADSKRDPINFLAAWLMRHNPKHNQEMAARLAENRESAALEREATAAKERAEAAAAKAAGAAGAQAAGAPHEHVARPRTYTAANGQVVELEPDEEVKSCVSCSKAFITLSGKTVCMSCREKLDIDTEAGEELKECVDCRKAFITTSGKTLCLSCRKLHGQDEPEEKEEEEPAEEETEEEVRPTRTIRVGENLLELEDEEELSQCMRCKKSFITLSGKKLCLSCREEFMQVLAEVDAEAGEELKACVECQKLFVTTSGKAHCLSCRSKIGAE